MRWPTAILVGACASGCARAPGLEPKGDGADEAPASVRATGASTDEPIATPAPTAPAPARALAEIGTPPQWPRVLQLARAQGLRKPAKAAALVGLGDHRWAAAIRTTDDESADEGRTWSTHLLIVDASADPPKLLDRRELVSWNEIDPEDGSRGPVALFADDYDGDGRREILVRFGFTLMLCGIGEVGRRELRLYDFASERLRPQIAVTLDDRIYFGASIGRESFADHNGDGRADLVITERSEHDDVDQKNDGKPIREGREMIYTYRPTEDDYVREGTSAIKGRAHLDFRMWDPCDEGESPGSSEL